MKRLLTFAMMLLFAAAVYAQSNDKISYQAVVRTSDNKLVYDENLTVTIAIANSESGAAVYGEQHAVTSNANGLISLMIGEGTAKTGNWSNIQWNNAWVTATIKKGAETLATHHVPMSAVPYALYAEKVSCEAVNACVGNGKLTLTDGATNTKEYTANQTTDLTVTLGKAAFTNNYNDLTNTPAAPSNSTITIKDAAGNTIGNFTLNQTTDGTVTLPALPMQKSVKFTATAGQTSFALTVPSGKTLDASNYLVQMYINGVYVGDNVDGVISASGTAATYAPANNGSYALMAGDRVQIVYWVK